MGPKAQRIESLEKELKEAYEEINRLRKQKSDDFTASQLYKDMSQRLKFYEITSKTDLYHLEGEIRRRIVSEIELKRLFDDNKELCKEHDVDYWLGMTVKDRYDINRIHSLERDVSKLTAQVKARDVVISHLQDVISGSELSSPKKTKAGRPPVSEDVKKRILKYRKDGHTLKEIASLEGVSIGFVSQICKNVKN